MVLKFYCDPASPPVRAVHFTIKHLGIPVEIVNINMMAGEHKSEEFLKINPLGTLPCIVDNGFVLKDSHAICIYLANKSPKGEKLYPSDPKKRALVNEVLFFEGCVMSSIGRITTRKIVMNGITEIDEYTVWNFEHGYSGLETYLKKRKYVAGDSLTIADFCVETALTWLTLLVPLDKEKFPQVNAYMERAVTWPFYAEVNETGVKKLTDMIKSKEITFTK